MFKRSTLLLSFCSAFLLFMLILPVSISAEKVIRPTMSRVYRAYRDLFPYIVDAGKFFSEENSAEIIHLVRELDNHFHSLEMFEHRYEFEPGFEAKLASIEGVVEQSIHRFNSGNKVSALQGLRSVSRQCFTCHATYGIKAKFEDPTYKPSLKDYANQAEFFIATRQYDAARKSLLRAADRASDTHHKLTALKSWVVLETRIFRQPLRALKQIEEFLEDDSLFAYERTLYRRWHASFLRWTIEVPSSASRLRTAENLLRQGLGMEDPLMDQLSPIETLRATGLLHAILDSKKLREFERRKALYLLGLAYSKLDGYLLHEVPELYLEQCIIEFPGTTEAQRSFTLYRSLASNTDISSTGRVSPETSKHLEMLHDSAYGRNLMAGHI